MSVDGVTAHVPKYRLRVKILDESKNDQTQNELGPEAAVKAALYAASYDRQ